MGFVMIVLVLDGWMGMVVWTSTKKGRIFIQAQS